MTWQAGRAEIEAALKDGSLQQVTGGQAAGEGWLTDARRKLKTAGLISEADPESAYVTAYDAARFALVGILAQQGLRATQRGGHVAVEQAVRAQFGTNFSDFGTLRRRRAELEYPAYPGEKIDQAELKAAFMTTQTLINAVEQLIPHVSLFVPA